jgi:hypothetical protein
MLEAECAAVERKLSAPEWSDLKDGLTAVGREDRRGECRMGDRFGNGGRNQLVVRVRVRIDEFDLNTFAVAANEQKLIALRKTPFDDHGRQRSDHILVDGALERPCAHFRRESPFEQEFKGGRFPLDRPGTILQAAPLAQSGEFFLKDGAHAVAGQRRKHDDLVEPVPKFGPVGLGDRAQHLLLGEFVRLRGESESQAAMRGGAQIRRQDDQAMAQIRDLTHRVRESAFVESLQEQIPNHRVRFLELVEKQNGEWLLADAIDQRVGVGERGRLPKDLAD